MSTVVVIGSGGREHALAWKLAQSPQVTRLIVAPGNDGMPEAWERWQFSGSKADFESFAVRARGEKVDLVVVGPDNPLADGIVDALQARGVNAFGPTAAAARLEASKAFAKEVMNAAGVPTAKYFVARTLPEAQKILQSVPWPPVMGNGWVIKADGLALGKGVRVCSKFSEALSAADTMLALSGRIVIEECVQGEELSWMAFCDGERCSLLEPARDYKRLLDENEGPNTGGMGAFSPVPGVTDELAERVRSTVFLPTLAEMKKRGTPFRGLLYAGLMVDSERGRFWVLEFNARFGDPETQVLLPRIEDDLYRWCLASARGDLTALPDKVPFSEKSAVVVVGAARGYPDQPEKGDPIDGVVSGAEGFFFAGVARKEGRLVTHGGRVLGSLGLGDSVTEARVEAYLRLKKVHFEGMQRRSDVGLI